MSTTGASEHEETISTYILHVHWNLPTVQVPPQILNICSLRASSLVWMGSCNQELARRMGLFCPSFFLAGFAGSRYPNKWACSQATIFDTNSIIPCNNYRLTHSASELSGFTCTSSLTMNEKFQYYMRRLSAVLKISRSLLVNECS